MLETSVLFLIEIFFAWIGAVIWILMKVGVKGLTKENIQKVTEDNWNLNVFIALIFWILVGFSIKFASKFF